MRRLVSPRKAIVMKQLYLTLKSQLKSHRMGILVLHWNDKNMRLSKNTKYGHGAFNVPSKRFDILSVCKVCTRESTRISYPPALFDTNLLLLQQEKKVHERSEFNDCAASTLQLTQTCILVTIYLLAEHGNAFIETLAQ